MKIVNKEIERPCPTIGPFPVSGNTYKFRQQVDAESWEEYLEDLGEWMAAVQLVESYH